MVTTKTASRIPGGSNYSAMKISVRILSTNGDILDFLLFNCAVIICDVKKSTVV